METIVDNFDILGIRNCNPAAKENPNDQIFQDNPGLLELCLDRSEGFLFLLLDGIKDNLCSHPDHFFDEVTVTLDGNKQIFTGAKALREFIYSKYNSIYNEFDLMDISFIMNDMNAMPEAQDLYQETQELKSHLFYTYGACEIEHEEL